MKGVQLLKKAPNGVVVVCICIAFITVVGAFVALGIAGRNTDDLARFVNTILNAAGAVSGIGALLYAGAAASSSANTEEKIQNGALNQGVKDAVHEVMNGTAQDGGKSG